MNKSILSFLSIAVVVAGFAQHSTADEIVELWGQHQQGGGQGAWYRHALNPYNSAQFDTVIVGDPGAITLGPGGIVYVANQADNVERHDLTAAAGSSFLNNYSIGTQAGQQGLDVGPDGNLYVQALSGSTINVQKLIRATERSSMQVLPRTVPLLDPIWHGAPTGTSIRPILAITRCATSTAPATPWTRHR